MSGNFGLQQGLSMKHKTPLKINFYTFNYFSVNILVITIMYLVFPKIDILDLLVVSMSASVLHVCLLGIFMQKQENNELQNK